MTGFFGFRDIFHATLRYERRARIVYLRFFLLSGLCFAADAPNPPSVESVIKPAVLKRVLEDREIFTQAKLEEPVPPSLLRNYRYSGAVKIRGSVKRTRKVMTDYEVYRKLISYITKADYDPKTHRLKVEGGIWKYRLVCTVEFEEVGDRWVKYKIVEGHFRGLHGDMVFRPEQDQFTTVYIRGEYEGQRWPPAFVLERGAEIVFGFTAQRMRNYIESFQDQK